MLINNQNQVIDDKNIGSKNEAYGWFYLDKGRCPLKPEVFKDVTFYTPRAIETAPSHVTIIGASACTVI